MIRFKLQFESGNAAMTEDPVGETVRILREVADTIQRSMGLPHNEGWPIYDTNGNRIGKCYAEHDGDDDDQA